MSTYIKKFESKHAFHIYHYYSPFYKDNSGL
jgi:hypothetical protein